MSHRSSPRQSRRRFPGRFFHRTIPIGAFIQTIGKDKMPQLPSAFSSPLQTGSALHEPVAASPLRSASAPARPPSTLRMLLKVQTADVHARLERDTRLNRLIVARPATTGSPLTQAICAAQYRATYVSFLLVAHALERGFEHALAGPHIARWFAEQGMNSESPSGSVRAKADLAALGVSADLDSHPPAPLSHPTSPAEALAIFYVREGSRFGGAMIGKCVEMWLGKDAPRTFSYSVR